MDITRSLTIGPKAPEASAWIELMRAIQLKGGRVRPAERMTPATIELIRGIMGATQSIFRDDNVLFWTLEEVSTALKKRFQIDADHRVDAELKKIPEARDNSRDATNEVLTAVRGIVRLTTMDLPKWGPGPNKTAVKIIVDKLARRTREVLGRTGRFAINNILVTIIV